MSKRNQRQSRSMKGLSVVEELESRCLPAGDLHSLLVPPVESYAAVVAGDDAYENNNSLAAAADLGTLSATRNVSNLRLLDGGDWFHFRTIGTGTSADYARINFNSGRGNLDLELYDSQGRLLRESTGFGNREQASLEGLSAGDYYVRIVGAGGASNAKYSLQIKPTRRADSPATAAITDDAYENNDTRSQASNLGTLTAQRAITGLRLYDEDWFRFTTSAVGTASDYVRIDFLHSQGDVDLGLYNSAGQLVRSSTGTGNSEQMSLQGLAAGTYSVRVYGYNRATNPNYSLTIRPSQPAAIADDAYENNDTISQATNFGTITTQQTLNNLRLLDEDWFRFRTSATGTSSDYVRVDFMHSQGDIDIGLYNSSGQLVRSSTGTGNSEQISLQGLAGGDYYVRIYGYNGARNANYSLTVKPPTQVAPPPTTGGNRVLYLSFDGATMTAADMRRWGGNQWNASSLDPDNNGTTVQAFFSSRSDRETIIQSIISRVQQDLSAFGITVRRHTGAVVENQGATTIFIGRSSLPSSLYHVACDIDYGNDNRTDIAFVGEETSWGSASNIALALSDVVLHEAGHTFGLFHVNSLQSGTLYAESMGLRYSTSNQSQWLQDTSFMNRTFNEYLNHGGGRGSQNSYQTMARNFGISTGAPAGGQMTLYASMQGVFEVSTSEAADRIAIRQLEDGFVEIDVNGEINVLGQGMTTISIHTGGDARDQIEVFGSLTLQLNVDRGGQSLFAAMKVAADEIAGWNGTFLAMCDHDDHDHEHSDRLHGEEATVTSTTAAAVEIALVAFTSFDRSRQVGQSAAERRDTPVFAVFESAGKLTTPGGNAALTVNGKLMTAESSSGTRRTTRRSADGTPAGRTVEKFAEAGAAQAVVAVAAAGASGAAS